MQQLKYSFTSPDVPVYMNTGLIIYSSLHLQEITTMSLRFPTSPAPIFAIYRYRVANTYLSLTTLLALIRLIDNNSSLSFWIHKYLIQLFASDILLTFIPTQIWHYVRSVCIRSKPALNNYTSWLLLSTSIIVTCHISLLSY